jgi:hypothetical protein
MRLLLLLLLLTGGSGFFQCSHRALTLLSQTRSEYLDSSSSSGSSDVH